MILGSNIFLKKLPPYIHMYTLAGFDITTHSFSLLCRWKAETIPYHWALSPRNYLVPQISMTLGSAFTLSSLRSEGQGPILKA
jgi:hypothetical protein